MQDIQTLKRHGVSSGEYKKFFSVSPDKYEPGIRKLIDLISSRIKDGRTLGLKEWRAYHAIDLAYDVPFNQTTPTLLNHLLTKRLKPTELVEELEACGLCKEDLFLKVEDGGSEAWLLNPPVFHQIFVPLVKAYTTMRLANIYNQRNTNPLLLYQPLTMSDHDQVLCEIVTDMVNKVATWYGYPTVLRQTIQQMLKYGISLTFPREEWDCEKQLVTDDAGKEKEIVIREGIRYFIPHPTRMFYDLKYPLTSLNTDTGVEFVGAWRVMSYGEILDNKRYWNRSKIFCGTNWFQMPGVGQYFKEVFPCSAKFPINTVNGVWDNYTRDDKSAWYNSGDRDQIVFVTEYFCKLIPKAFGLADYPYKVWHRFTVAGDDTVIWAAPCAYVPSWGMGYDYEENSPRTSSMALECIPWQDMLTMHLSQMNLQAQQNLTNVVFYDNQQIDKDDIKKLTNRGSRKYKETVYIGFDSLAKRMGQQSVQNAFFPVKFEKQSIQEFLQLVPTTLSIMERVLQITAQESGAAASHQQSKEEVERTGQASANRVMLTFASVDEGIDAWKRQQFDANMAYRDSEITAQVSKDTPDLEHILGDLGFKQDKRGNDVVIVKGNKKSLLKLETFARTSEGSPLQGDKEVAQTIFQTVGVIAGQEDLKNKIGAKNLLVMIEYAAKLAGAPRDFRLREQPKDQQNPNEPPPPNIMEAIKAAQQATLQAVEQQIAKPAAEEMGKVQNEVAQMQQMIEQLKKIAQFAQAAHDKDQAAAAQTQQKMQADQATTAQKLQAEQVATQQRLSQKDAEFQQQQRQDEERHQAEMRRQREQAALGLELKKNESTAKIDATKTASEA